MQVKQLNIWKSRVKFVPLPSWIIVVLYHQNGLVRFQPNAYFVYPFVKNKCVTVHTPPKTITINNIHQCFASSLLSDLQVSFPLPLSALSVHGFAFRGGPSLFNRLGHFPRIPLTLSGAGHVIAQVNNVVVLALRHTL